MIIPLIEM